jgi:hypothetical protein
MLEVTVHNFSTFWALFWALFEHFLAIFASTFLGFYQRERPNGVMHANCFLYEYNAGSDLNYFEKQ